MKPVIIEQDTPKGRQRLVKKKNIESDSDHENDIKLIRKSKRRNISHSSIENTASNDNEKTEDSKNSVDLSKYKDEYKQLIESVKKKTPQKSVAKISPSKKKKMKEASKIDNKELQSKEIIEISPKKTITKQSSFDAFKFMMDARKKSIGMNSPGKESTDDVTSKDKSIDKESKAKRTLALSLWADKKGASEKRELEERREENAKISLQKRADSFKKMLLKENNKTPKKSPESKLKEEMKDYEDIFVNKKRQKRTSQNRESKKLKLINNVLQETDSKPAIKDDLNVKKETASKIDSSLPDKDNTFLKNLSPSIKKSESVLSYFEKTENDSSKTPDKRKSLSLQDRKSSKTKIPPRNKKLKTKKIKVKVSKTKSIDESNEKMDKIENLPNIESISNNSESNALQAESSERPRRNVGKPVKYMQESSASSDESDYETMFDCKTSNKKGKSSCNPNKENVLTIEIDDKVSPIKIINLQSPGQIKCVKSPRTIKPPSNALNEKLAPLFRKGLPKPKVDPVVMEARRLFLQSGIPETIKKRFEKTPSSLCLDSNEFLTVFHVQQKSDDQIWNLPVSKYTNNLCDSITDVSMNDFIKSSMSSLIRTHIESSCNTREIFKNLQSFEINQGLRVLKEKFPNFPVYNTFKQLWLKFAASPKPNSQDSGVFVEDSNNVTDNVHGLVWTEKYKPLSSHDIIGNFQAVSMIKRWLTSWREFNETSATKTVKRTRKVSSSSSDFEMSDSESRDSFRTPTNVMVITGPPGSGKTSSIYAICNELNINVLEINASSKRTGKKILSEMHEATQSHKVLIKQNSEPSFSGLLNKKSDVSSKDLSTSFNQTKNNAFTGNGKKSENNLDSQKTIETNMSLMLIDDADIVFEEDDGFISALSQLVQTSKRPMLLVASDESCPHLQRFKTDSNHINFKPFSGKILGPWIDILLLIECNKIIPKLSSNLLESNNGDARKSILQLQYWIAGNKNMCPEDNATFYEALHNVEALLEDLNSSRSVEMNNDHKNEEYLEYSGQIKKHLLSELLPNCNLDRVWWNLQSILIRKPVQDDAEQEKDRWNHMRWRNLYKYIDTYSTVDLFQRFGIADSHNTSSPWQKTVKDSTSELENMTMYRSQTTLMNEICNYLHKSIENGFDLNINHDEVTHIDSLDIRLRERHLEVYNEFSQGVSLNSQLDRRSLSMDYMATLRCISRSENQRSTSNLKRNNRFHNYLNTLNILSNAKVLNNACKIFYP